MSTTATPPDTTAPTPAPVKEHPVATTPRTAEVLPPSAAQRRFWLVDRLEGPSGVYNTAAALRLRGPLVTEHLQRAFQLLVDRHEALRTVFPARDGSPVQLVLPRRAFELGLTEAGGATDTELRGLAGRLAEEPFDLTKGPLLRAELIALGPRDHLLVVVLHHIVVDRWSFGLMMSELSECHAALAEGRPVRLPELPVRYADHVAGRQALLDGGLGDRLLAYWRGQLAGAPEALELPTDRPRPPVRSFRGASVPVRLDAAASQAVRDLCKSAGATPFMVLLAAFQAVLGRHAGTTDVVVATGPATRAPGTERLVGSLVNTVLLRTSLAGDPTFAQLVERVRGSALDAFDHQELPFDRLVEELAPSRDLSRNPLAQVGFVLQNAPATTPALTGLDVEPVPVDRDSAHMDLDLQLTEEDGCFTGFAEFALDLFDAPTVARLLGHWTTLLSAAVHAPETRLSGLPMLTGAELDRELHGWNDTDGEFPAGLRVDQLFARQAARTPGADAVTDAAGTLDYRTLDAWAARIAHRLRRAGVGPDTPVALCLERGAGLSAAMLGTLRAGGAFLGLDPSYPADRLAYMLADAAPAVVLANRSTAAALPPGTEVLLLEEIPADGPEFGRTDDGLAHEEGQSTTAGEASLAYLVYTSGSTGRPKGVAVTHRAIVNTFAGLSRSHGFGPGDRMIALHSPSFDPAVHDCLAPLVAGATVVYPAQDTARDPRHWAELVARHRVTVWSMGPAGTEAMVAAAEEHGLALDSLRTAMIGGDVLPPALPPRLRAAAPGCRVVNSAGVAEAAFCNNEYLVPEDAGPGPVHYGRPLLNQRLLVLDATLRAVPAGVPGELCVAGEGLARGYLGRPGLTAERFVPHPYGRVPGERLYRTGDLARRRADGELELLGRADNQVKIRGFRVEPGEVTGVLLGHPGVSDAVVVARGSAPGERRLAAYWVPATGRDGAPVSGTGPVSGPELAAWLRERLPGHLVPALWTELAALPLSPNGKVDRAALPEPAVAAGTADRIAPRTPDEAAVAAIWQRLLELPEVGVLDDFFALGGHSLLANRLVSALRTECGVEVRLREVFAATTVAAQAALLGRLRSAAGPAPAAPLPPVTPADRSRPLPLSFAQQRMWLFDRFAPGNPAYHVPTAVRIGGDLDPVALAAALRALMARHEVLRTVLPETDGAPVQRVLPASEIGEAPLTVHDLAPGERAEELADAFVTRPFDLAAQVPLRALLLRTAPAEHLLVLVIHHIALDGWSMGVLVEDLAALYDGHDLPPLPVQYADYAQWQADRAAEGRWTGQLEHWRERLTGPLPVLELPTDRSRPATPSLAGEVHEFTLSAELTQRLRDLGARHGATLFMVLLAGYQTLLGRLSGADDVVVGTPVAGRGQRELDSLVGCFVNTLALRGDLSGDPAFAELLERTRDRALADFDGQDVPFEQVLDAVGAERDPARHPVFQTMLTLQSARPPRAGFAGLDVEPVDAQTGSCLMDLMFTAAERDGRLAFTVEYATDLFDAESVVRLAHRFGVLLEAAADAPGTALSRLPLLDAEERRTALTDWNATARPLPSGGLHDLVAAAAARTPGAPALEHEGRTTSYAELEAAAERCAARLRGLGIGAASVVAVHAAPTPLLVTALLGVLKAGAAFTTLDPALPEERLRLLLELSGAQLVLTDGSAPGRVLDGTLPMAPIEAPDEAPVEAVHREATEPDALACVFFTSGTTGVPKGSMFTHRGLVNFTLAMAGEFRLAPGDRFLQLASTGFDVLLEELFPALAAGATVVLPGARLLADGTDLTGYLAEHRITGLELTTAYWHDWTAELERTGAALPAGLRFVAMGGERVRRDRLAAWQRYGVPLVHVYGLTEVTCTSTTRRVDAGPVDGDGLPIGRPLANTTVYLLDPAGAPVPIGSPGELHLGGAGLARGYLGRPGLTAERFVPDPFGAPGARLYRTGDLARHRADGEVEFIGRADQQVKIRGHRIEPGEVEARLAERPEVGAAAVIVREDEPGEKRLVGYVVAAPGTEPDVFELRAALRERLPEYLVPAALVLLPALPLNGNGKLDRGALPRPGRAELTGAAAVAPRTPAEAEIAELAGDLLGLAAVGVHDNLFDLGLHSLLAARFAARVRETCRVEVPLRVFYEAPTVAELALRVVQLQAEETDPDELVRLLAELEAEAGLATA
ncbi:amino acid adenylation domain-containing protein [Streptomyces sp. NBC_00536]|uniref:amino acid adenylation domain-containing protein n=1 Tax=Streptomyces sp. NBC_00536 TaxID=2975769 RepID=UPI002E81CA06|nr:amino acid adenylation domain-containing protein [Streptomyces sp. NBC_00536]WUC82383.1 amino acid adenylation domain-containing protein [Streptomyces sp. NBC_00536]